MATVPGENGGDDLPPPTPWKVGELARRTGLSVRTLHYYDEIGLLSPSARTASGHRLYTAGDVARLQQVRSLRQLGLSLGEIRDWLRHPGYSPRGVIRRHLERLREQIERQRRPGRPPKGPAARHRAAGGGPPPGPPTPIGGMTELGKDFEPQQPRA